MAQLHARLNAYPCERASLEAATDSEDEPSDADCAEHGNEDPDDGAES